jgi:hypothetical protein
MKTKVLGTLAITKLAIIVLLYFVLKNRLEI